MHTGLLWFDNSQADLAVKVNKAFDYYAKKYGRNPDMCLVHPSLLEKQDMRECKVVVRPYRPVLPGHIWIGVEDKE